MAKSSITVKVNIRDFIVSMKDVSKALSAFSETEKEFERIFSEKATSPAKALESVGIEAVVDFQEPEEFYNYIYQIGVRKMTKASPFRKGRKTGRSGNGSQFLGLKDGESHVFAPLVGLDELISADMHEYWDLRPAIYHPCIGRGCPGCEVGNEARYKAYLPVLLKSGEIAIYPFTVSVYNQLEELEDALQDEADDDSENIKGYVIRVSRKGTGMATRYTVTGTGKQLDVESAEIPDFLPQLGPTTKETIWDLLESKGYDRPESEETEVEETKAEETKAEETEDVADESEDGEDDWGDV